MLQMYLMNPRDEMLNTERLASRLLIYLPTGTSLAMRVCVFSGSRAEFGLLAPLIECLQNSKLLVETFDFGAI